MKCIMKKSKVSKSKSSDQIIKVRKNAVGKYEVFFDFLPVPVQMNRDYLETVIEEVTLHENETSIN